MRAPLHFIISLFLLCVLAARADWPDYRGPWHDGHVAAPGDTTPLGLPLKWSETENVKWKTPIPHRGWSTPVILDGRIWLTTATEDGHGLTGPFRYLLISKGLGTIENRSEMAASGFER